MELRILNDKENKLLERREVNFELVYEKAPPTRLQALELLAKQLKVGENLVIIKKLGNVFGLRKILGNANVYSDPKNLEKTEPKHLINRIKKAKEKLKKKDEGGA